MPAVNPHFVRDVGKGWERHVPIKDCLLPTSASPCQINAVTSSCQRVWRVPLNAPDGKDWQEARVCLEGFVDQFVSNVWSFFMTQLDGVHRSSSMLQSQAKPGSKGFHPKNSSYIIVRYST